MNKLEKRFINGIEVTLGSGNVFADLGLPNADKLLIKSGLVIEITRAIRQLGITQEEAAKRMGIYHVQEISAKDDPNGVLVR